MKEIFSIIFTVIFSYLLGSLNSAIIVCKIMKHEDIRNFGSKNAGLTNVLRTFGKGCAGVTLLCDLFKGIIAVVICRLVVTNLFDVMFFNDSRFIGYLAGIFVMLGHIFPVFYGFHGGKGVLIAATTLIAIDPLTCLFSVSVFAIVLMITKYVSVGSICAAVSYPVFTFITQTYILKLSDGVVVNTLMAAFIAVVIIYMHRSNIKRLINGTENKFGSKKK